MHQYKVFALLLGIFFCVCPFVGHSQLQVSVVLPMQMPAELSEWQTNPSLVQIIITSLPGTPEFPSARCEFVLRNSDNQAAVVSTKTNHPSLPRFPISAGPSTQIRFGRDIVQMNSLNINQEYQTNFLATNSLPEGNYEFCLEIYDDRSNQLIYSSTLQGICSPFIVVVPDPPSLILPADGDVILSNYPVFSWTPVMMGDGSPVRYNLKVVPLFEGQNARFALDYNEVIAEVKDIQSNSYMYSPTDRPYIHYPQAVGFAWQVQAISLQGTPVTRNNGKSELFTFYLNKDTTTTITGVEIDSEPDIVQPEYIPNKKRSIQFGEFWVTLANDIDCNSCILNVDGFAFLPFLNDSVRVTLVNVPITNVDKPYYIALSGEASNNFHFSTKTKNAASVKLSSLKLTPNSASLSVSTAMNWQSFGWMNGEDASLPKEVAIKPNGFQYSIALDVPWKRNGTQIGLNSLFEATIDSIYTSISFSKLYIDGSIVLCPTKNSSSSTRIEFDCVTAAIDLSANQASILFEKSTVPLTIVTPLSTIASSSFAIDLSTSKAISNDNNNIEWRGIQLNESKGTLSVKAPFSSRFPINVIATNIVVTPTSNSFVYSGSFNIDSLSCSYGGFPLVASNGTINLDNNQTSDVALNGSISVLSSSKPTNWTDLENIPVQILVDQDLQLQVRIDKQSDEEFIATLPLQFTGIDDTLSLNLSKGVINVQSESEATLTFLSPIVFNKTYNQQLGINNLIFKSYSNKIEHQQSNATSSSNSDFSLQGALFSVQTANFIYNSSKEYSLSLDGVVKGIGKKMPEKLAAVPFSQLQLSTISPITSKGVDFDFHFTNQLRAFGKASIVQEQFGGKKFFGLKGNAQITLDQIISVNDVKGTLYIGSLDAEPYWFVSNIAFPISADETLAPSQSQRRSEYFSQYIQTQSQQSISEKLPSIGSFEMTKLLFGIGSLENTRSVDDVQLGIYFESIHSDTKKTNHKLASYIYSKNSSIETIEGQLQLGQRGNFSLKSAKLIQLANRTHLAFSGEGNIALTNKESSKAKLLIEHSNDETAITLSEISGTISVTSTLNEPLRTSNTDIHFDNATLVVSPLGLEAESGVTISSIFGTEGNEPSFIAIQNKPLSNLVLDVADKEQCIAIANVKGTIITSYDDDPCTQWGTLKGISPQGILANPGSQSVSTFSVGELSECGTPMSTFQQGNFSLCYSTMSNEFSCSTPLTIKANNSVQSFSVGTCSNCSEFEQKITSTKKSLQNTKPVIVALEQIPNNGETDVDAYIQPKFRYKVTNVQKTTNTTTNGNISLELASTSVTKFQFDSLSTEYYILQNGKYTQMGATVFAPCSQYQMRLFVYLSDKNTRQSLVLSDTLTWSTSSISKTVLASQQLQYSFKNSTPIISIVNKSTSSPIQFAQNFWKQHTLRTNSLVEKGVALKTNSAEQLLQLSTPFQQKTEIVAIPLEEQCSQSVSLSTTAYPQLQDASFSMSSMNDNEIAVQFTNIPAGIEYTLTIKSYCNNELQQIISKQQYSPAPLQQKQSSTIINILSILGTKPNNCTTNGYNISVEFPPQFTLPTRCISIGTAPQCITTKKE